jgi:outer membrane protein assembly factor BamE
MTQVQVRYVMGSPLVTDPFHPNRWDYVYLYEKKHKVTESRRLTVIFADGKLDHLEGDVQLQDTLLDHPPEPSAVIDSTPPPTAAAPTTTTDTVAAVPATIAAPAATPVSATTAATSAAPATASSSPSADAADPAVAQSEAKPKQPGFFSRVLEKIGL